MSFHGKSIDRADIIIGGQSISFCLRRSTWLMGKIGRTYFGELIQEPHFLKSKRTAMPKRRSRDKPADICHSFLL
jgi:hypothetical protein